MLTTDKFIEKAKAKHGDIYDYSLTNYVFSRQPVDIVCRQHGKFSQIASNHLRGAGCPTCSRSQIRYNKEEIISKLNNIHNIKYDYHLLEFSSHHDNVKIICPNHGEFEQRLKHHLRGSICPKCRNELPSKRRLNNEQFITRSEEIHLDKYDYSNVNYVTNTTKVKIACPIHGEFLQTPANHLAGKGCSKCGVTFSSNEEKIETYLIDNNITFKRNTRSIISPYELDFYLPDYKIAIECDGIIWHSEKFKKDKYYHLKKTVKCDDRDIQLVHIFEDEINNSWDVVKIRLGEILGLSPTENYTDDIITLDRRWHKSAPIGYSFKSYTSPKCYYVKGDNRISQSQYEELVDKNRWYRLWDCGDIIFEKKKL